MHPRVAAMIIEFGDLNTSLVCRTLSAVDLHRARANNR